MIHDGTMNAADAADSERRLGAGDIVLSLRRQIAAAKFLQGERLPPERSFATHFGVSRGTVRDALRQLEQAGLVQRRPGSGTYVTYAESEQTLSIIQSTSPLELIVRASHWSHKSYGSRYFTPLSKA